MFQTGSGRLYTVKRLWSIDPYGNSHKDHLQDGHDEKQRSHEPVPLVERHAHHCLLYTSSPDGALAPLVAAQTALSYPCFSSPSCTIVPTAAAAADAEPEMAPNLSLIHI